ncbi:MAG TPA: hypothetical protein VM848_06365 [Acidimicrobiia bacterium]|nr:hypothetical protein [Acidimicrobiia bacterium]
MSSAEIPVPGGPSARLVVSYFGDPHHHRSYPQDDRKPFCDPTRIHGVLIMYHRAQRENLTPCPKCWISD